MKKIILLIVSLFLVGCDKPEGLKNLRLTTGYVAETNEIVEVTKTIEKGTYLVPEVLEAYEYLPYVEPIDGFINPNNWAYIKIDDIKYCYKSNTSGFELFGTIPADEICENRFEYGQMDRTIVVETDKPIYMSLEENYVPNPPYNLLVNVIIQKITN